jgi:hypothetical protein
VTVYVDDMRAKYGRMIMCHMLADSPEELHAMADRIGVQRKWFQSRASSPHYDIALSKRSLAVAHGAVEVIGREIFGELLPKIRENWPSNGGRWL